MQADRPTRQTQRADQRIELMQTLLHSSPELVYRVHRSGHLVDAKPALGDDVDPQRFIGKHISEVLPPAAAAMGERLIAAALASGELQLFEYTLPIEGRQLEREARIVACSDEHVLVLVRDTTERKRAEAMLLQRRLVESLGAFSAEIAHTFNNRLMAILGQAELARSELPPDSPVRQRILTIEQAAGGASELVKQILAYSGGTGSTALVAMPHMLHELKPRLEQIAPRGVKLELEVDDSVAPLTGDPEQLRQVVLMLAANAFAGVDDGGEVRIRLAKLAQHGLAGEPAAPSIRPATEYIVLEVADNGPGMDSSAHARVFEPFYTSSMRGGGEALAVVLGIVHSHGGAIYVESGPEHGTLVRVVFPPGAPDA